MEIRAVGSVIEPFLYACIFDDDNSSSIVNQSGQGNQYSPRCPIGIDVMVMRHVLEMTMMDRNVRIHYIRSRGLADSLDKLDRGEAQVSTTLADVSSISAVADRHNRTYSNVSVTPTVVLDRLQYIIRRPESFVGDNIVLQYFKLNSIILFFLVYLSLWYMKKALIRLDDDKKSSSCCNRSAAYNEFLSKALDLPITAFFLVLAITLGVYSNFLSIGLYRPADAPMPFQNFPELIPLLRAGDWKLIIQADGDEFEELALNVDGQFGIKDLKTDLAGHIQFVRTDKEALTLVNSRPRRPRYVTLIWQNLSWYVLNKYCDLYGYPERTFPFKPYSFLYNKQWIYGDTLNSVMTRGAFTEHYQGFIQTLAERDVKGNNCSIDAHQVNPIRLSQLNQIIFGFLYLSAIALLALILEKLYKRFKLPQAA